MKNPAKFDSNDSVLESFVIAASSPSLESACDLLFVHGNDLTWGNIGFGLFLVEVNTGDNFNEVVEVAETRSKLSIASIVEPLLKALEPRFVKVIAEVKNETNAAPAGERDRLIGNMIAGEFANEATRAEIARLVPEVFGLDQWMSVVDAIAGNLLKSAMSLRERQLACTGKSNDDYDQMLYALQRLNLCDQLVRVAYPDDSLKLEIAAAPYGEFRAIGPFENSNVIGWARIKEEIAALKRGQDRALPLFIARFINRYYAGPQQAYACALYGERSEGDIDVVVPALDLGFEIKLYMSPFSHTDTKLDSFADNLSKQLPTYVKVGCKRIIYVCNLSQEAAESVAKRTAELMANAIEIIPIGGNIENLVSVLEEIGRELQRVRQDVFVAKVNQQTSAAGK